MDRKHPDDVVKLLADLAAQHGYRLVALELTGTQPVGLCVPHHTYKAG
ncbi:hypothetical protein [Rhodobacter lacus]|uniref:Uncharacterized protein n=1 Tax=Rhodobacter lacus TaxID=1641972 RepID=A0ABW5AC42_9RHOB